MDAVFKALSDPQRRRILQMLRKSDMSVTEIASHFSISGPTLSHHLDTLKRADLVVTQRKGQFIFYSLNTSVLEDVLSTFYSFFQKNT